MDAPARQWGLRFDGCSLCVSARRLLEHVLLGQINPFPSISATSIDQLHAYIDVANCDDPVQTLTGYTLADLLSGRHARIPNPLASQLLRNVESVAARRWLRIVRQQFRLFIKRRARRNVPEPFLPTDGASTLGISGLKCALLEWLRAHGSENASISQWRGRIENLANKGLRIEEVAVSGLLIKLDQFTDKAISGNALADALNYEDLRLSVVPVIRHASNQLEFVKISANTAIKRITPKLKTGLITQPQYRDRVLGYWIDGVMWADLLGPQQGWIAFTHRGQPVVSELKHTALCDTPEEAKKLANEHALSIFPKLTAKGQWSKFRLTGGEAYREWLITLPHYPPSYFSSHYDFRNVLLHVRCDMREAPDGGRVLVLQEVQSDWAQEARRNLQPEEALDDSIPIPPWLQEWPALALKLMLLHAVHRGASALAWTPGKIQVERYGGLGKAGLLELYDRTLPAELNRLIRIFGRKCETVDVYQPLNFYVEPAEIGYEVFDEDHQPVGKAKTWEQAQALFPDGAHEELEPLHGVQLDTDLRQRILNTGFCSWGGGIR